MFQILIKYESFYPYNAIILCHITIWLRGGSLASAFGLPEAIQWLREKKMEGRAFHIVIECILSLRCQEVFQLEFLYSCIHKRNKEQLSKEEKRKKGREGKGKVNSFRSWDMGQTYNHYSSLFEKKKKRKKSSTPDFSASRQWMNRASNDWPVYYLEKKVIWRPFRLTTKTILVEIMLKSKVVLCWAQLLVILWKNLLFIKILGTTVWKWFFTATFLEVQDWVMDWA